MSTTYVFLFFLNVTAPPEFYTNLTLFPYTTLFRSMSPNSFCFKTHFNIQPSLYISVWLIEPRSEEHTSERQSHSDSSSAAFCLKKKTSLKSVLTHMKSYILLLCLCTYTTSLISSVSSSMSELFSDIHLILLI